MGVGRGSVGRARKRKVIKQQCMEKGLCVKCKRVKQNKKLVCCNKCIKSGAKAMKKYYENKKMIKQNE